MFQQPHNGAQLYLTPVPRDLTFSSSLYGHCTFTAHRNTYRKNTQHKTKTINKYLQRSKGNRDMTKNCLKMVHISNFPPCMSLRLNYGINFSDYIITHQSREFAGVGEVATHLPIHYSYTRQAHQRETTCNISMTIALCLWGIDFKTPVDSHRCSSSLTE